jgi:hypothetical protein
LYEVCIDLDSNCGGLNRFTLERKIGRNKLTKGALVSARRTASAYCTPSPASYPYKLAFLYFSDRIS